MKHLLLTTIAFSLLLTSASFADPIHQAARDNDIAGIQVELDKGVKVNVKDTMGLWVGQTPLEVATQSGNLKSIELLITKGADPNESYPILGSFRGDYFDEDTFDLLILSGAKVDVFVAQNAYFGWDMWSPENLTYEYLKSIFEKVDLNSRLPDSNQTLLDVVTHPYFDDTADLTEFVRELGHKHGSIHGAALGGDVESVKEFLSAGVNVNSKEGSMIGTPLHYAVLGEHKEIVELLIDKGANVNAKDANGATPQDYADGETVDLLRKYGAKTSEELKALMPQLSFMRSPFGFTFNTLEGKTYRVESGIDLKKWNNLREIKGTGNEVKFIDVRRIYFSQHFYRVVIED
jgi:ankyrin repeat protein